MNTTACLLLYSLAPLLRGRLPLQLQTPTPHSAPFTAYSRFLPPSSPANPCHHLSTISVLVIPFFSLPPFYSQVSEVPFHGPLLLYAQHIPTISNSDRKVTLFFKHLHARCCCSHLSLLPPLHECWSIAKVPYVMTPSNEPNLSHLSTKVNVQMQQTSNSRLRQVKMWKVCRVVHETDAWDRPRL